MIIIHKFPPLLPIWSVPNHDGTQTLMDPGFGWETVVYYDLPELYPVNTRHIPQPDDSNDMPNNHTDRRPLFTVHCLLHNTEAIANVSTTQDINSGICGIDTMATRNFIDYNFVKTLQVRIKKHPEWLSNTVTLGDNSQQQSIGRVHIRLQLQQYVDYIWADVLPLPPTFQLILC